MPPIERPPRRFWVLIASVALLLVGGGVTFVVVVGLKPIAMEFGWPRSVPSLAFSLQFVGSGLGAIIMGHALDRLGMGKPALIGSLSIGAGAIAASQITEAWQLHLIYGVLIGFLGIGGLAAPLMANITKWYEHRRGMAVGIVASGQSLAGIVWPPVFGYAQDAIGWRDTFFWFGIVALAKQFGFEPGTEEVSEEQSFGISAYGASKLKEAKNLRDSGIITEEEFQQMKEEYLQ